MKTETTYSEELMKQPSWKDWMVEYRYYVTAIAVLSSVSLGLMVQNYLTSLKQKRLTQIEPMYNTQSPKKMALHLHPKKIIKDALFEARHLAQESKLDDAITLLLKISHDHRDVNIRDQAAELAKRYHILRKQRFQTEKRYLEAYVLYETYPDEACERWRKLMNASDAEDKSIQKAKTRFHSQCRQ